VVDVPINDGHTLHTVPFLSMARANRDIVEEAKSHRGGWTGVMPRGSHRAEGILHISREHRIHNFDHPTRGMQGNLTGLCGNAHITAGQIALAGLDEIENIFNIAWIVAESNLFETSLPRVHNDQVLKWIKGLPDDSQSFWTFGMPVLRAVMHKEIVNQESCMSHEFRIAQFVVSLKEPCQTS
jgi:hypothetical protein